MNGWTARVPAKRTLNRQLGNPPNELQLHVQCKKRVPRIVSRNHGPRVDRVRPAARGLPRPVRLLCQPRLQLHHEAARVQNWHHGEDGRAAHWGHPGDHSVSDEPGLVLHILQPDRTAEEETGEGNALAATVCPHEREEQV